VSLARVLTSRTSLFKDLKSTNQHFTTAYTPWSNGTIERLCKEVLRAIRAQLAELHLSFTRWTQVVDFAQSVLKQTPSKQRGGIAPVTAFTGLPADSPLLSVLDTATCVTQSFTFVRAQQLSNIEALKQSLYEIHKAVLDATTTNRASARSHRNSIPKGSPAHFSVGEYVLAEKREFPFGENLTGRWRGPRRIIKTISDLLLFFVEDLRDGSSQEVHATRIKSINIE
jgi:hypothetical protein